MRRIDGAGSEAILLDISHSSWSFAVQPSKPRQLLAFLRTSKVAFKVKERLPMSNILDTVGHKFLTK